MHLERAYCVWSILWLYKAPTHRLKLYVRAVIESGALVSGFYCILHECIQPENYLYFRSGTIPAMLVFSAAPLFQL